MTEEEFTKIMIGQRVLVTSRPSQRPGNLDLVGKMGKIVIISGETLGVEFFFSDKELHDTGGYAKPNHGWYVTYNHCCVVEPVKDVLERMFKT